jgi:DNA-binding MarR family transcriptional regulator
MTWLVAALLLVGSPLRPAAAAKATPAQLAERLGLERTTLVRNLKFLEDKGWIEPVSGTGRSVKHRLTPSGRRKLDSAIPLWEKAQREIEAKLGGVDPEAARQAMRALRRASH